jgi:hypothetical protein
MLSTWLSARWWFNEFIYAVMPPREELALHPKDSPNSPPKYPCDDPKRVMHKVANSMAVTSQLANKNAVVKTGIPFHKYLEGCDYAYCTSE